MLTLVTAKNPCFSNFEKDGITLDVVFLEFGDTVLPFTAMPNDVEEHGREIYQRALNGEFGEIQDFIPTPVDKAIEPQPEVAGVQTL